MEDHADTARLLGRLLRSAGHDIALADTAASALDQARTHRPELAILDLSLPDSDGSSLASSLHDLLGPLPLIALSGHSPSDAVRLGLTSQFDLFLQKPVSPTDLLRSLTSLFPPNPRPPESL